jgi:transposase
MEVVTPRCCGLDVRLKGGTACVVVSTDGAPPRKQLRTLPTMPADLAARRDWLAERGVAQVAMESTGVYRKPTWRVLEGRFDLLLVNARHVKAVPGRKTDVKDAEWPADLLRPGLLRGGFGPGRAQQELRDLTRLRTTRVQARAAEVNRLLKTLERAGVKLGGVVTDVTGVSARAILAALLAGETEAAKLAGLAKGRLRAKLPEPERALAVVPGAHHRVLLAEHLAMLDDLAAVIARLDARIAAQIAPFAVVLAHLQTIPGVGRRVAEGIVAEGGTDRGRFPTSKRLASRAALCPGHHVSAGKRRGGKTRKGHPALRALPGEAAPAAARSQGTYLSAQYHRLAARRGKAQASGAVAHSILVRAYAVLRDGVPYREPGGTCVDERHKTAVRRRLVQRLERLGHAVTVAPLAARGGPHRAESPRVRSHRPNDFHPSAKSVLPASDS